MGTGGAAGVDLPPGTHTWRDLRAHARGVLNAAAVPGLAPAEVGWMLERASGMDAAELAAAADDPASARAIGFLERMLERRVAGEPLQYVLGVWQFHDVELVVDRRVLIPRPETEVVAEVALAEAERLGIRRGRATGWGSPRHRVVDLGTGSGALTLVLTTRLLEVEVWATDASADAVAVARSNVAALGPVATHVRLAEGSWWDALDPALAGTLALVVSNPPYLAEHEHAGLDPVVRDHEPKRALVAGPTGLEALTEILDGATTWLDRPGTLVLEHAPDQGDALAAHARARGAREVVHHDDLAGRRRVLVARW
jgi:release factor glutamine methyltransferase